MEENDHFSEEDKKENINKEKKEEKKEVIIQEEKNQENIEIKDEPKNEINKENEEIKEEQKKEENVGEYNEKNDKNEEKGKEDIKLNENMENIKIEEINNLKIEDNNKEIKEDEKNLLIEETKKEKEDGNLLINEIKEESKDEMKEESKNEMKEESKNEKKEESKNEIKEESKNEIKEESKNEIKSESQETEETEETKKEEKKELSLFSDFEIVTEVKKDNKKEENNINSKEYIKLKTVLINSFILEKKKVQENKEKKNNKENENEYIVVDKNEQECEEMLNNAYKKGKCSEINKYKDELNLKKKVKRFHLFNYNCEDPKESKIIYKLGKVLVFTYRKNFPKITSYKTKKTFTTDAWWGCMVRCGQMILSRGIYRILKSTGMNTKSAIYFTTSLFNNYPIQTKFLHQYFRGMITKYKSLSNFDEKGAMEIKEFFPPFSIRTICDVGELFERTAGEWFSDVIITGVFKKISEFFELFQDPKLNVKVMKYQSCIEIPDILEKCFVQKKYNKNDNNYIHFNKKYYYFDKMGIIFVNVRVGLDKIPKQYFEGIKELFTLKECIGIIGGKSRLAYYFIGYNNDDDSLLYLDPHVSKEAHKKFLFNNILDKHVNKEIHQLKMSKMSTAFTIGFCFRNYAEFLKLYEFWQTAKQKDLPILGMVKQNLVLVEKYKEKEEDYSPTYEDKDEDDF